MKLKIEGDSYNVFPLENRTFFHARNFEGYMFSEHTVLVIYSALIMVVLRLKSIFSLVETDLLAPIVFHESIGVSKKNGC